MKDQNTKLFELETDLEGYVSEYIDFCGNIGLDGKERVASVIDRVETEIIESLQSELTASKEENKRLSEGLTEIVDYFNGDSNDTINIGDLIPFVENILADTSQKER